MVYIQMSKGKNMPYKGRFQKNFISNFFIKWYGMHTVKEREESKKDWKVWVDAMELKIDEV